MILVPNSESLREYNSCHSPEDGRFCSDPEGAIRSGQPQLTSEDQFLDYHRTGHIPSNAYEDAEAGKFDYIHRERFTTLLSTRMVGGVPVEIRLWAEPASYPKRREALDDATRDKLYDEFEAEAKRLGTTTMMMGLDLGRDSKEYAQLKQFEKRWLDSGEDWIRDANGDLVYHTPEEMRQKQLPEFTYTVGAFVNGTPIGYAGDEFGATGVYVSKAYQRHGIGLELLHAYLQKSGRLAKGEKIGQMTMAGAELVRSLHRKLVRGARQQKARP